MDKSLIEEKNVTQPFGQQTGYIIPLRVDEQRDGRLYEQLFGNLNKNCKPLNNEFNTLKELYQVCGQLFKENE